MNIEIYYTFFANIFFFMGAVQYFYIFFYCTPYFFKYIFNIMCFL
jgi:hypothetical protein